MNLNIQITRIVSKSYIMPSTYIERLNEDLRDRYADLNGDLETIRNLTISIQRTVDMIDMLNEQIRKEQKPI